MNENWPRWFEASVHKAFKDACRTRNIIMFVEGMNRSILRDKPAYIEVRVDGPYAEELSKNFWQVDMEVNVVISTVPSQNDIYAHTTLIGIIQAMCPNPLRIYRYGSNMVEVDDGTRLGCMSVSPIVSGDRPYRISRFGQITPDARLLQSTVEVHYRGEFDG